MISTNLKFKKSKPKKLVCHFLFALFCFGTNLIKSRLIFFGQFWMAGNSTPGPSKAEKLVGSGLKKKVRLSQEECFLESKQKKNTLFHYLHENNCHTIDFVKIWSLIAILLKCNSLKLYFLPQESFCMNNLTLLEENLEL